jgi:hypothetical protein
MSARPPRDLTPAPSYVPLVAIGALGVLLAVVGGALSADFARSSVATVREARTDAARPAAASPRAARELPRYAAPAASPRIATPAVAPAPAPAPAPAAAEPAARTGRATPELVARVTEEATAALEQTRAQLVERCQAEGGLTGRSRGARFTFNVTFDANGREIARGINEDRRFRAPPELSRCVRSLPPGSLRVTPPGANVGVRVAMMFP